jgi:membrane-associated phospholipid phosphatase
MRSSAVALTVLVTFSAIPAFAQSIPLSNVDFGLQAAVDKLNQQMLGEQPKPGDQKSADDQQPPDQQPPDQKPPAAVGEMGKKPTRGFVKSLLYNLGDDVKHMPRKNSIYWLAGGSVGALAIHPADQSINQHLATSQSANIFFFPGSIIGQGYFILPAAAATYVWGRVEHQGRVQHLGMDEIEAGLLSLGFVEAIKVAVQRPRPTPLPGQTTTATGYSFPSGHATLTFAAATVLQQHLGYKAGIPTYLIAAYVAMSRLHDNVHWASDVVFGTGLGIMIGRSVTWHGRNFYGYNVTPAPIIVRGGGGIMFVLHADPPSAPVPDR